MHDIEEKDERETTINGKEVTTSINRLAPDSTKMDTLNNSNSAVENAKMMTTTKIISKTDLLLFASASIFLFERKVKS